MVLVPGHDDKVSIDTCRCSRYINGERTTGGHGQVGFEIDIEEHGKCAEDLERVIRIEEIFGIGFFIQRGHTLRQTDHAQGMHAKTQSSRGVRTDRFDHI